MCSIWVRRSQRKFPLVDVSERGVGLRTKSAGTTALRARRPISGIEGVDVRAWSDRFSRFRLLAAQFRFVALRARRVPSRIDVIGA